MDINEFIKAEVELCGNGASVEPVPGNLSPSADSLKRLQKSIIEAADANDAMLQRSMMRASGGYLR